jgi:WD40 repeat protein
MKIKHDAFISYSHGADSRLARVLEDGLERLAKPLFALRALDVFRDETSLSANPNLWTGIQDHLASAEWFVLLACPESAASEWCRREVRWWVENRAVDRMLIVVTSGDLAWNSADNDFDWSVSTALSSELQGRYPAQPLYLDLRWARGTESLSLNNLRFRDALLSLAATIRGIRKDDLDGEDVRQLRRTRRLAAAGVAAVACAAVIATWQAIVATRRGDEANVAAKEAADARDEANVERDKANVARDDARKEAKRANDEASRAEAARTQAEARQARTVAYLAQEAIRRGDAQAGMLSALSVLPRSGDRSWSVDAEAALLQGYLVNREEATLFGHAGVVWWLAFTPDGRSLLSASEDGSLKKWDLVRSPATSVVLGRQEGGIRLARLSPDGNHVVAAPESGKPQLWLLDAPNKAPVSLEGHTGKVIAMDFSADSSRLLTGSEDKTARIWRLQGPQPESTKLEGHDRQVQSVRFSADSRQWITASEGAIRLWSVEGDLPVSRPLADLGVRVNAIEFSPQGTLLATAARDKKLALWQLGVPAASVTLLEGHTEWVWNIAFDQSGKRLATTAKDNTTRLWAWDGRRATSEVLERYANWYFRPLFSPDGTKLLAPSTPTSVSLWNLARSPPAKAFAFDAPDGIASAAFSPDGRRIAVGTGDGTVRLLRLDQEGPARTILPMGTGTAMDAAWSPDGKSFAVFHRSSPRMHLWRLEGGRWNSLPLEGHTAGVNHAAFSPDGSWLASASRDGTARLWSINASSPPKVLSGHRFGVNWVAFSLDGRLLATASQDSTARVWSLKGDLVNPVVLTGHTEDLFFVAFTPKGRLITVSRDRTARVWTFGDSSGQHRPVLLDANKPKAALSTGHHRAAVSADGRWLALTFDDPIVELWDLHAQRPSAVELAGARDRISHLAFSIEPYVIS